MKITVEYQEVSDMYVQITSAETDERLPRVLDALERVGAVDTIVGAIDDVKYILPFKDIHFFESAGDNVFAQTNQSRYRVKARLHEVEKSAEQFGFIRISKWCVANIHKILKVESGLNATMSIVFKQTNIEQTLTRSYVKRFKATVLERIK